MKKLIYLLMSLSFVAFVACSEDKDNPVNNENTRTEIDANDAHVMRGLLFVYILFVKVV